MNSEDQPTRTEQPAQSPRAAAEAPDQPRTSARASSFDGWLDYDEMIREAWSSYSREDWTTAEAAAARALSAAKDRITRKTEKEFADMAIALRSEAAAHVVSGCVHERRGDIRKAMKEYREAVRSPGEGMLALLNAATADPRLKGPKIELASALCRQDFAHEALVLLDDLQPAINDGEPGLRAAAYAREAEALDAVVDYEGAIEKLDLAIKVIEPDSAGDDGWLRGTRGWILRTLARYQEARSDFEAALAKDPENWWWIRGLADVDSALGRGDEAAKLYSSISRAARDNPEQLDAESFAMLAWCHHLLGNQEEAVRQILHSVYLDPGLVSNQFDLALISLGLGQRATRRQYEKGLEKLELKPIPRRYGLLHEARANFESELHRTAVPEN